MLVLLENLSQRQVGHALRAARQRIARVRGQLSFACAVADDGLIAWVVVIVVVVVVGGGGGGHEFH